MRSSTAFVLSVLLLPAFLIVPSSAADPGALPVPCDPSAGEACVPRCVAEFVCPPDVSAPPCVNVEPIAEAVTGPRGHEPVGCCNRTLASSPMTTRWTYAPGFGATGATGYNEPSVVPSGNSFFPNWAMIPGATPVWKDNLAITTNPSWGAPVELTFEFVMCDGIDRPVTLWANADDRYQVVFNNGALNQNGATLMDPCSLNGGTCWGSIQSYPLVAKGAPFANTVRFHVHNDGGVYNNVQPAMVQWKLFY